MSVFESVRVALRSLVASKLRSGLTMLGIVIGVGAVIALVAAGEGAQAQVTQRFQSLGSNLLVVTTRSSFYRGVAQSRSSTVQRLTNDDVEAIARLAPSIAAIAPQYSLQGSISYGNNNTQTSVLGVTPEYRQVANWTVDRGRFVDDLDIASRSTVVVLGSSVVEDLFGDSLLDPLGKTIKINRENYLVVGLLASKGVGGFQNLDNQVLIPLSSAQVRFGGAGTRTLNSISLQVRAADRIDRAKAELTTILRARHGLTEGRPDDFTIQDQAQIVEMVQQTTQTFTVLLGSIAGISLVVGGIGIMNIMLVSVTERTREIGIRKAVGARQRDILGQFLAEAMVLSVLGGVLGVLAGWGAAQFITPLFGAAEALITSSSVIMALSVSVGVGLFFGLYPAYRAARLNPIDALRYE